MCLNKSFILSVFLFFFVGELRDSVVANKRNTVPLGDFTISRSFLFIRSLLKLKDLFIFFLH